MIAATSYAGRKVAVLGLARSGAATLRALRAAGAEVVAWDDDAARRNQYAGAGVRLSDLSTCRFDAIDALVLSPGVPFTHPAPHPAVVNARAAGVEIVGDVEVFAKTAPAAKVVGITGTNGKSTTAALIGFLLERTGRAIAVGGNIGRPVLDLDVLDAAGAYVIELSSYQIDLAPSLVCDVAVLVNISADHLDRHGGMAGYVAVKRRIFAGQDAGQVAVIGIDDTYCRAIYDELRREGRARVVPIAVGEPVADGVYVVGGRLHDATGGHAFSLDLGGIASLRGRHNWQNAAAAFAAARALGLSGAEIADALPHFPGLPHRMESVATVAGVEFVNDSKATNADAAARALASFDAIYWIAGGRAKEGGLDALAPHLHRVRKAYLIGEAAPAMAAALKTQVRTERCGTLTRAVAQAATDARASASGSGGAVVLLSPACASFDQFRDYEARGDAFRTLVAEIAAGGGAP